MMIKGLTDFSNDNFDLRTVSLRTIKEKYSEQS